MVRRRRKGQQDEGGSHAQPVPLPVAASLVYHQLNRKLQPGAGLNGALDSTAFALSQVADIYYIQEGGLVPIPRADLAHGGFEDSGASFRAASGRVYRPLAMRRGDLMEAILILKAAGAERSGE
jgi:hypothetical protein